MAWNKTLEKLVAGNLLVVSCLPDCKEGGTWKSRNTWKRIPQKAREGISEGHMGYSSHPNITRNIPVRRLAHQV